MHTRCPIQQQAYPCYSLDLSSCFTSCQCFLWVVYNANSRIRPTRVGSCSTANERDRLRLIQREGAIGILEQDCGGGANITDEAVRGLKANI